MSQQDKILHMSVLTTPDMANFSGAVHGGALLKLLDQAAYACAAQYCRTYVVTASLDMVHFKDAVKVGELVTFKANVNYTGKTSMEIGVKVLAQNLKSGETRHTNSCYFTMVAKGEDGRSVEVPPLILATELDKKLFKAAEMRKAMRTEIIERNRSLHVGLPDDYRS